MCLITFDRLLRRSSLITFYPLTSAPGLSSQCLCAFIAFTIQIMRKESSKKAPFDLISYSSQKRHTIEPLLWPSKAVVCKSESLSTAYNCGLLPRSLTSLPPGSWRRFKNTFYFTKLTTLSTQSANRVTLLAFELVERRRESCRFSSGPLCLFVFMLVLLDLQD